MIARAVGDLVDTMMNYTKRISYVGLLEEVAGRNPLKLVFFGERLS
ncbi:hypothetical protein [Candidatus Enterovibrio escicola]|nr:hypothetical protein [Candidatus Enterovibrio escacola]